MGSVVVIVEEDGARYFWNVSKDFSMQIDDVGTVGISRKDGGLALAPPVFRDYNWPVRKGRANARDMVSDLRA